VTIHYSGTIRGLTTAARDSTVRCIALGALGLFAILVISGCLTQTKGRVEYSGSHLPDLSGAFVDCDWTVRSAKEQGFPFQVNTRTSLLYVVTAMMGDDSVKKQNWRDLRGGYDFQAVGTDYDDYMIEAVSLCGGRSWFYDPRTGVTRLVFVSAAEKRLIADWTRRFFRRELSRAECSAYFLAIPCIMGIVGDDEQRIRTNLAQHMGDFLLINDDNLRRFVLDIAFCDHDAATRHNCLSSIISVLREIPEFQARLRRDAQSRLDALSREKKEDLYGEVKLLTIIVDRCKQGDVLMR
jgi:hypothetical protein